jgi:methyl-accepting chemotaxis protein PixJ
VTVAYQHLKTLATETQGILSALTQQNTQHQQTQAMLTQGSAAIEALGQCISALQTNGAIAAQQLQHLSDPVQKVAAVSGQMTQLASQMKLQAMNAALEATRRGDSAQEFAGIGEKVLELARQLDTKTVDLASISHAIQTQLLATTGTLQEGSQQMQSGLQRVEQGEQIFARMVEANTQLQGWIESMLQSAQSQSNASTTANQMILEVASRANQATEQAIALSDTVAQLSALTHQEETA